MKRFFRLVGWVLLPASIAAFSCGGDGFMTKGDYCSRLAGPLCNREVTCGNLTASQQADCVSGYQSGCCGDDGTCGERALNQQDETELETIISDCNTAAATANCTDLAAGNPPVACGGTSTSYVAASLPSLKTGVVPIPHQMGVTGRHRLAPR